MSKISIIRNVLFFLLILSINSMAFCQNISIKGYILDSLSREALIGAIISSPDFNTGTASNNYGYFSINVPSQKIIRLQIQLLGYNARLIQITPEDTKDLTILMSSSNYQLGEITITSKAEDQNVNQTRMSVLELPIKDIKSIPMIAGERDVLKAIQFLPGVQSGNEGTTGFFVRGGNIDQNLVLLDEATVYNPNHLFGLVSTFNVNSLNNVSLLKGGFPAQYGGRLSSILDITMKEGNKNKYEVEGGIGLLSSNISVEGPIQKKKSSFIISGRRSYFDLLTKPFIKDTNKSNYYLYDINAKINFELSKRDHLFISLFKGLDNAQYTAVNSVNYGINFGNTTGTLRWNHLLGSKIFVNSSFIYNDYHLGLSTTQNNYYALLYTRIRDINAKHNWDIFPNNKHSIKVGVHYTYHSLSPASVSAKIPKKGARLQIKPDSLALVYSNELAIYANDEWIINSKLGINYGVRIPTYFTNNSNYVKIEPRITAKYSLSSTQSIKLAYTEMNQFLHLIPNSTASLPTDIWISSDDYVKPQNSKQFALGYFRNFKENNYETSIEVYYKNMSHQALFKEGTQIVLSTDISKQLTFGKGNSYGLELFVRKKEGRVNGWLSYTLSKTTQTFDSLNYGRSFPFTYDRRHVLNVVGIYQLSKRWSLSANFVFNSGGTYTLPSGKVPVYNGGTLYDTYYSDYNARNNYRLNAYNRLDLAASYKKIRHFFRRTYESEWAFSLYNVYSRQNPYFVYLTTDPVTKEPKAKQVSLLPIIPGVSYNFKF